MDARELLSGGRALRQKSLTLAHDLARYRPPYRLLLRARRAALVARAHRDDLQVLFAVGVLRPLFAQQCDDAVGRGRAEDYFASLVENPVEVEDRAERLRHLVEHREYARLASKLFQLRVGGRGPGRGG